MKKMLYEMTQQEIDSLSTQERLEYAREWIWQGYFLQGQAVPKDVPFYEVVFKDAPISLNLSSGVNKRDLKVGRGFLDTILRIKCRWSEEKE